MSAPGFRRPLFGIGRKFVVAAIAVMALALTPPAQAAVGTCDNALAIDVESTIGTASAGYSTLSAAFAAINAGTHRGTVTVEVCGNPTEPGGGAILNASGSGAASYATILVRPVGGVARTISGNTTAGLPTVDLNGADNVTIDGLNTGGNVLTISNTRSSSTVGTATIRFIADATNNTIANATIRGSFTGAAGTNGGNIFFSTGTTTGNDNNTISNCDIGPAGTNLSTTGVYGNGTTTSTTLNNSGIVVTNSRIFDYFGVAVASAGVYVSTGNTGWTITNNRFFQTATRTWTTGAQHSAINIQNATSAAAFTITGNTIGFASSAGSGTYALTGSTGKFAGIIFNGLTSGAGSSISSNTVASVSLSGVTSNGATVSSPFIGILVANGVADTNSNVIGSQGAIDSLVYSTNTTTATDVMGIYNGASNVWTANGNLIGGVTASNAGASGAFIVYGLRANPGSVVAFNAGSNFVGGTVANSIRNNSTSTAAQLIGLASNNAVGNVTANTIRSLTGAGGTGTTSSASVIGILNSGTGAGALISQNTIHTLANSAAAATTVCGIQYAGATSGTNLVTRNVIHSLTAVSATAVVNGINVSGGTTTYANNMIRLGIDAAGASIATGLAFSGISEPLGTDNFYFNSVYVGGSGVGGSAATYAFNSQQTASTRVFRNNIFYNARSNGAGTGKHYAVRVGGTAANPAGLTVNHNDYLANGTGGVFGFFNSLDVANLAAWRSAVGQDANSISGDPLYVNPTGTASTIDLHINTGGGASPVENAGTPIAAVTNDIDGDLRHPTIPDIGADEVRCHAGVDSCNDGSACTVDSCIPATGCVNTAGNAGAQCRAAVGTCDLAETCDGVNAACPADGFVPAAVPCRASAGLCDVVESCTGVGGFCPADGFAAAATECRAAAGLCDVAEICTGSGALCPSDGFVAASTECRASAGSCDSAESCTGSAAACPADVLEPASTVCRGAAGGCDVAENCTGSNVACPADVIVPAATECRPSAGFCDVAESCDGANPVCPADIVVPAATECRPSAGICDASESCDGILGACPPDAFLPPTTECRASTGICDSAEACTGASAACPADALVVFGTTCRAAAGGCDAAEVCTGSSTSCPADVLLPAAAECRPAAGNCDIAEVCDGASTACPAEVVVPAATECRPSGGFCDVAESCDGASGACPADAFEPSTTVCRASTSDCDRVESCTGSGATCPADVFGGPATITATSGVTGATGYATLGAAFTAINDGTHTGAITIDICANLDEGSTPATLNSSGAGPASYTSVLVRPVAPGVSVVGNPVSGFGVVQLNGADNVTIDGDNPNTPGINRGLVIVNAADPSVAANSVIRIATSAAVTSANDNTIKNLYLVGNVTGGNLSTITSATSSSAQSHGLYVGGNGGATATSAPTALTTTPAAAASGTTVNALTVDNNWINNCARAVFFNGAAASVSTGVTVTNNSIGTAVEPTPATPPYTEPATTVYVRGVGISGTTAANVTGNTILNVMSYVGAGLSGVELTSGIGAGPSFVDGNTITNVIQNSGNFYARGVSVASASGPYRVAGNAITNIQNFSGSSANQPSGILLSTTAPSATLEFNRVTTVKNRSASTFGAQGVTLAAGSNVTVRNNVISDVNQNMSGGSAFSTTFGVFGLRISGGTGHKIHHNSVNLVGGLLGTATSGQLSAAFTITTTSLTGIDVRNNVFANTMTGGTTSSAHVPVLLPSSGTSAMNLTWNNNVYYTGSTAGVHGIAHVGTTYAAVPAGPATYAGLYTAANFAPGVTSGTTNLRRYTSTLLLANTDNDNASFGTANAAPFATATDLHINTGLTATPLESAGVGTGVTGVLFDMDSQDRPGPAGSVNGGATAPDIGADEFDGVPLVPNDIQATAFVDPPSAGSKPEGAPFSPQASFTNGGKVPQAGVTVRYRIFDHLAVAVYNQTATIASLAPNATTIVTFPSVALSAGNYVIKATAELVGDQATGNDEITGTLVVVTPLCGNYDVGSGGVFASLTKVGGAFSELNGLGASCNVTFSVVSDLIGETGSVALNQWMEVGAGGYTLTIKPSGGARSISGVSAGSGLIVLNGADRVTIDGSVAGGTDRSLTLSNTNPGAAVVWIKSASAVDGSNFDTVKNCVITGLSGTTTMGGVVAGSGVTLGNPAEFPNSNNTIQNNVITRVQNAVYVSGNSAALDQNWLISGNTLGSTVAADKLGFRGVLIGNAQAFTIGDNTISGVVSGPTSNLTMSGIHLSANLATGSIARNRISDIKQTNTSGWGSNGLLLGAVTTASNVTVSNNFIWDVASQGFGGVDAADNGYGIVVSSGGGYKIYANSVNLNTNQLDATGISAGLNVLAVVTTAGSIDVRGNIFSSMQTVGTRYAVLSSASAAVFSSINTNDYFAQNVGFIGGAAQASLAAWRVATGQDANSIAADPLFVSATDLHINTSGGASPVENSGTPLVAVTADIDGELRNPTTPDIGADEARCHAGVDSCDDGNACTIDSCNPATGCFYVAGNPGAACRPSAGNCDVAETCDGASTACPADVVVPAATECRASAGICDVAESCSGVSGVCPANAFHPVSTECRASAGVCDAAESCDGTSAACPAEGFVAANTQCRASAGSCDLAEVCDGASVACPADAFEPAITVCRGSIGACDVIETCTGSGAACPADVVVPAATECRASAGICDVAEACDGLSGVCAADVFQPSITECRASAGVCDIAESCTGSGSLCPADVVVSAATECRASAGACDLAEACDGASTACPFDAFEPASTVCRGSVGTCDVIETCTGSSAACPADVVVSAATECRASAGICDVAEACDGVSGVCASDVFQSSITECRASAGVCDVAESCTGSGAACPADAVVPAATECREAAGTCDLAEACDGASTACPVDVFEPVITVCRGSVGTCDVIETCTGSGAACPADVVAPAATECRASAGICDVAEACDGVSGVCAADAFKPSSTECRASAGICDAAESCTGSSAVCPSDGRVAASTECRAVAGACDIAESCDGTSIACPTDVVALAATECRPSAGNCDIAESCDGASVACPAEIVVPAATVCRPSAGICDVSESCDGVGGACPADAFQPPSTECRASVGPCDMAEFCTGAGSGCPADALHPSTTVCRPSVSDCDRPESCTGSVVTCPEEVFGGPATITATGGVTGATGYATLGAAFTAINDGTHTGAITIDICANLDEGSTPATLNSSGAGPASYTSVLVRPVAPGVWVAGNPVSGFGVVQLNGADNVTIDGDNPNTPGINRGLVIVNTADPSVAANSVIRIATSAAVTSADDNTIKNLYLVGNVTGGNLSTITSATSSSAQSHGLYVGGNGGATATSAPTALTTTPAAAASGTTVNALTVDNNWINNCARAVFFNGAAASVSTVVTVTNNSIGTAVEPTPATPPYTEPATTVYVTGVGISGTTAANVTANTILNVMSYVGAGLSGVELTSGIGVGPSFVDGNTITNVIHNSGNFYARGVSVASASGPYRVAGNAITNIQNFSGSSANQPSGIFLSTTAPSATLEFNRVTTVKNRSSSTSGAQGVALAAGNEVTVRNNVISDVNQNMSGGSAFSTTSGVVGLRISGGTGHKIHHNSVNLFGGLLGTATSGQLSAAFAITATSLTDLDVRNNVFANTMTGGTIPSAHVPVFLPSSGTSAMNLTWNNNAYYTGPTAGVHGIAHVGTTYTAVPVGPATYAGLYAAANFAPGATSGTSNLRSYTSTLLAAGTDNDNASFGTANAAPFATATDLHINTGLASTRLESGGADSGATGVLFDMDSQDRPGPAGSVNGGATAPDIGADEFDGALLFPNDMEATAFVDPASAGSKPEGAPFSPQASFTNNGTAPQAGVTVRYRILNNLAVEVYNQTATIASLVPNATTTVTFPAIALSAGSHAIKAKAELAGDQTTGNDEITGSFVVESPLCGNYDVGSGGVIASLTNTGGAFSKLNSLGASCNVTFSVVADLSGETGSVVLNQWTEVGLGGYTVTVKPSGAPRAISGSSSGSGLIILNGADRVTIDGSIGGGTDRSLTLSNTSAGAAVIWIRSASAVDGSNFGTVKNCVISGDSGTATMGGVVAGSGVTLGNPAEFPNSNNTVQNNVIMRVQTAVHVFGNAAVLDQNWLISGNTLGSTVAADKLGLGGVSIGNAQAFTISGNTINGVVSGPTANSTMSGIHLAGNIATGSIVKNRISDIKQTNVAGGGSNGLLLGAATTASNVTVSNNFIWDVASQGFGGVDVADNGYGIVVAAGGGYKIYANSVNLNTDQAAATGITAGLNVLAAVTTAGSIDLRGNIFSSVQTVGTRYGVLSSAPAAVFSSIDANDYFAQDVGFIGGSARATLLAWQVATGQDVTSIAADPRFVSATDLHIDTTGGASPVENSGTPFASVTDDIDGELRNPTTPDIGADEVRCHAGVDSCDDGNACTVDSCNPASGCFSVPGNTGATCRASAGLCDVAETCDGASTACPADVFAPAITVCRGSVGTCDVIETCTGSSAACPADAVVPAATECRASAGICDVAEACDGLSGVCAADVFQPSITECRASAGVCDIAESCTGSGSLCPADVVVSAATECRASAGACDLAEACDGASTACPFDAFEPASTVCRGSVGTCDVIETCTGSSAACPADVVVSAATECRASAGICDVAEACDGLSGVCASDVFQPSITECRASAGACDVAESCTGSGAACPADAVVPAATECRGAAGTCDLAEACDGASTACPVDAFKPAITVCRDSIGTCDVIETCTGSGAACPADVVVPAATECRASAGICDLAEACDGVSGVCAADAFKPSSTECRVSVGACDVAEACTGSGAACPADVVVSAATECRPSAGLCDVAEACDGASTACPADALRPANTECRAAVSVCDGAEFCTGSGAACPVDVVAPAATVCRPSTGVCDVVESCDGVSGVCPADAFEPPTTVCRASTSDCDRVESCTGSAVTCPADVFGGPATITATGGVTGPTGYATLGAAFTSINDGTHTGAITIDICANLDEGSTPATLNSSGAGPASYTSVLVRPVAPGVWVAGNPVSGFGVVQLNGADNVTIDGDNPNTPGINRGLVIINAADPSVAANSVIRIATSAAVTSADDNTIKNLYLVGNVTGGNLSTITSATSSSAQSHGLYVGGSGGATATSAPTALTTTPAAAASGTTVNALTVDNNWINNCARAVFFNGAAASVSTGVTVTNNSIGTAVEPTPATPPYTEPATTVYVRGVGISGTTAANVTGNTILNVMSYVGAGLSGVELTSGIGAGPSFVDGNTITNVIQNSGNFYARGVSVVSASGTYRVAGNAITNIQNFSGSSANQPSGIFLSTSATSATIELNRVTTVTNRNTGTFGAQGVNLAAGSNVTVRNNVISDVNQNMSGGSAFSTTFGVVGLRISGGTGHKIHHNSVNLFGSLLGTATSSQLTAAFAITATSLTGIDARNNVFANTMTGGTASSAHVSVFLPSLGASAMNLTWNNNAYYTGGTAGVHGIAHVGTTYAAVPAGAPTFAGLYTAANFAPGSTSGTTNLRRYTSTLLPANTDNDNASFGTPTAAPFATATDLHINTGLAVTPLESGGADTIATGVSSDIDSQIRSGPVGSVNGGATAPDIGADEFDGVPLVSDDMQATAFVDPTSGASKAEGVSFSPQASFTNNSMGTKAGVTVRYRIQNHLAVEVYNQTATIASLVPNATTVVTFPSVALSAGSYVIKAKAELVGDQATGNDEITGSLAIESPLCGNYDVGSGGVFASLTNVGGAFSESNRLGASCNVTFSVVSDLIAETGSVALNQWTEFGVGGYTLTIKPTGSARSISGVSGGSGLIVLNGADRVTIDGSVAGGTDRSLTLSNTNPGAAVVWIKSASAVDGSNFDTVKNCVIAGLSGTTTMGGVVAGSGVTLGNPAEFPNSNNTIQNNVITRVQNAVYVFGGAAVLDQNWLITGNTLGSTVPADKLGFRGVLIGNAQAFTVGDNTINGVVSSAASSATMTGIQLAANIATGSIARNRISDIKQTNVSGWGSNGMLLGAATTASNVTVSNNFIWDVASRGFGGVDLADNGYGIVAAGGGGYKIYANSVNLNTDQAAATGITAGLNVLAAVTTAGSIDLRGNIFSSVQTIGTRYGVLSSAPATVFSSIDNNDYFAQNAGFIGGSARATLLAWQVATGQDVTSIAADPLFVSATDLHIDTSGGVSPVENSGTPLAAVTDDIDGELRSPATPDIGADEVRCHVGVDSCDDGNVCTVDSCDLVNGCFSVPGNTGTECRASAGICDVAETCNGLSPVCPGNSFAVGGTACRFAVGGCDVTEVCTGSSTVCPADGIAPAATECRVSVGVCDVAETCDGATTACPADVVVPAATPCRASAGVCDVAEACDGAQGVCPADVFEPQTSECRASTGLCDPAELCIGSYAACPPDAVDQNAPVGPTVRLSHHKPTATTTIGWTEVVPGPFNVYRGSITTGSAFAYNQSCFVDAEAGASTIDTTTPAPAQAFFYLVSRKESACSESNVGQASDGADRPNLAYCPLPAPDADTDGVEDALDNCPAINNTAQTDVDSDGHGDDCDNCPTDYNPDQLDTDNDGAGNSCDP